MKMVMALRVIAVFAWTLSCAASTAATIVDPTSENGLDYYSQGGVVVDGVAYFTANDYSHLPDVKTSDAFPRVVAFNVNTFRKLRAYPFDRTYDSSPLVFQKKDGGWLVIAHEHKNERTAAYNRDTGKLEWTSEANQPGSMFFGFSFYDRPDGSKLIFVSCTNGLHAMSGETGRDVWWVKKTSRGGITPCVDQQSGWVFYQCDGKLLKIRAADGEIIKAIDVASPNRCVSWNTVLVNDRHGYFVATRWYGSKKTAWDSAIRVYDRDLKYGHEITSCAPCIIAHGKLFSGDLGEDRIVVTRIAENSKADWPGPFCDPQINTYAAPDEEGAVATPMKEITNQ